MLKNKCRTIAALTAMLCAGTLSAGTVLLNQNFEKGFTPGKLTAAGKYPGVEIVGRSSGPQIVKDSSLAFKLSRDEGLNDVLFKLSKPVPAGENFTFSAKVKLPAKSSAVLFIGSEKDPAIGVFLTGGQTPKAYNAQKKWQASKLPELPDNQYFTLKVDFNAANQSYEIAITYPDGTTHNCPIEFPLLNKDRITHVRLENSPPVGSFSVWDDLLLEATGAPSVQLPADGVIITENFDRNYPAGILNPIGKTPDAKYLTTSEPHNFSISSEQSASAPYSLKVLRNGRNGYFALKPLIKIPARHNYSMEFKVFIPPAFGNVVLFYGKNQLVGGLLLHSNAPVKAYNVEMGWATDKDTPELPENQWTTIRVNFNVNRGSYTVDRILENGSIHTGNTEFPMLDKNTIDDWRFDNILPQNCYTFVDDIKVAFDPQLSLDGREDFAPGAVCEQPDFAAVLKGNGNYIPDGKPVEITLQQAQIELLVLKAANGKALPGAVKIMAQDAAGRWIDAGTRTISSVGTVEAGDLKQIMTLRLLFQTGKNVAVEQLKICSPAATPQGDLDREWAKKLDAEYQLPVYDLQYPGCDMAKLTFINHTKAPLQVKINMHERLSDQHYKDFTHTVPVGTSHMEIDLKGMKNGEYVTSIIDFASGKELGRIKRLLRLCTSPDCAAEPKTELTGKRILFPDGFYLSSSRNIKFTTGKAKAHLVKEGTPGDDAWVVYSLGAGMDKEGNIVVNYRTMDRQWMTASEKRYHAKASIDNPDQWTHGENYASINSEGIFQPMLPGNEAKAKPGPDGKITYRFYDPEKDGPVNLAQVQCKFISYAAKGALNYEDNNWGVMTPESSTVWALWHKAPGETLILSRRPLVSGFPGSGELEPPDSGSDLGFGQWLDDDGETLYFGFGRHLIRYEPYIAPYDNLKGRDRIVGMWRTRDGINWEQGYVAPPDTSKPAADQHYGGMPFIVKDTAGPYVCVLQRYSGLNQQMNWEIIYSWDGFRWTRFQREPQFLDNGPFGHWTHGGNYLNANAFEHNGKVYQSMRWMGNFYHFMAEFVHTDTMSLDHVDAKYMESIYKPRKLERWPYFHKYFDGSWEKLAEYARNSISAIGILEYRKDSYFFMTANDEEAQAVTVPVQAEKSMSINTQVRDGGYLKVTLLDENDQVIPGYEKEYGTIDDTGLVVFENLPQGKFKVKLDFKNADIYSLMF